MPLLKLGGIGKSFAGTVALKGVSIELKPGEVVALIGENGAGKSTLIKVLAGVLQPDTGTIEWMGSPARFSNPRAALTAGIATIHQELACFEKLTVAENLTLGEPWPRTFWGGADWNAINNIAADRLAAGGLDLNPRALIHGLSPAQRQEVAIARALSQKAKLLILDEPTASLTEPEVARLMLHLARLRQSGVAVLYVTHRLDEVLKLTNRVLVLRDGVLVAEYPTSEASIERMVREMVGRELVAVDQHRKDPPGPEVFSARHLSARGLFQDISFEIRSGEILGLAGLVGAGRSELARAIFGLYRLDSGSMRVDTEAYAPESPRDARRSGIVYVPEERKRQGFVLDHSLQSGISIGLLDVISRMGWVRAGAEKDRVNRAIEAFRIKARDPGQAIGSLSGGNQQKALLARWLETDPKFIVLDEPTRGVDVGAKAEIHRLIAELAAKGKAILLISSDLPEILALSDRIIVMHHGRVSAEFTASEASQERILLAASGFNPIQNQNAATNSLQISPKNP